MMKFGCGTRVWNQQIRFILNLGSFFFIYATLGSRSMGRHRAFLNMNVFLSLSIIKVEMFNFYYVLNWEEMKNQYIQHLISKRITYPEFSYDKVLCNVKITHPHPQHENLTQPQNWIWHARCQTFTVSSDIG
jgi:hypothetical protein